MIFFSFLVQFSRVVGVGTFDLNVHDLVVEVSFNLHEFVYILRVKGVIR